MFWKEAGFQARKDSHVVKARARGREINRLESSEQEVGFTRQCLSLWETRMNKITQTTLLQKGYIPALECLFF